MNRTNEPDCIQRIESLYSREIGRRLQGDDMTEKETSPVCNKVAAIVATRNRCLELANRALRSVAEQTRPPAAFRKLRQNAARRCVPQSGVRDQGRPGRRIPRPSGQ